MNDPYLYPHSDVLKNLAGIHDTEILSYMEAEYTSIRLAELVTKDSVTCFDFATLWKIHPYREVNTRSIIIFCSQFIESKGFYIDSDLFKDNAQYVRTALVTASALFSDLGDMRKPEYLEKIVLDALQRGWEMKQRVSAVISKAGFEATEGRIHRIVNWNRLEYYEHEEQGVRFYFEQMREE